MSENKTEKQGKNYKKGTWIGIGIAFGSMFGMILDNPGAGIGLGLALGAAFESHYQKKDN